MNLELWLTTLITISPQQDDINTQQLKPAQILEFMSTGNVWVRRGHGMHVELLLTLREEPLPYRQLQDLVEKILQAPVWEQLMLQPSLPSDVVLEPGVIHLNINHAADGGPQEEQRRHRIFSDVPNSDVRSPEGFPTISLCSVRFRMDIVEAKQLPRAANKKLKASARKSENVQLEDRPQDQELGGVFDVISDETSPATTKLHTTYTPTLVELPMERKRKKLSMTSSIRSNSSPTPRSDFQDGMELTSVSNRQPNTLTIITASDRGKLESIIDGALRLSVCGSLTNRSKSGLKIKASTFSRGLADVAPALWKPGYLPALSLRAQMVPTISRSLSRVACSRTMPLSLKNKLTELITVPHQFPSEILTHPDLVAEQNIGRLTSSIASRLWQHLQKNLVSKSATTLQGFMTSSSGTTAHSESDDMLEEVLQQQKYQHIPRPCADEDEDTHLLDGESMVREAPWSSTKLEGNLLRKRTVKSSTIDHDSGETGDDLLLDPVSQEIKTTVNLFSKIESRSLHSGSSDSLPSHDVSPNKLPIQALQYSLDSNWTTKQPFDRS
ncbi:uncharacterized protein K460DRAFT_411618 [Cucurbitaria berberidis CBS 394.84]|uniref:Uncharacterized protein n=1 Tax=Cucurbitaria berberidis CBS 394.84 TaxID=1168544 RepID=A0A9P4LC98_9PLEO|nr:uncharacterized protein K460DRAFT_411618 [Cucurbitaria berberidis CBS 394.84]KAF1849800.1 hypothetical protein K460DRAFT_411618 [Cucurbitaria berberidis CBS 394.84]